MKKSIDWAERSEEILSEKALSVSQQRHVFRFRLRDDEGSGTFLTDEPDLSKARDRLADKYGDRLALVVKV